MYFYLKNLSPTQQIGALFVLVFGLLLLASVSAFAFSIKEFADDKAAEQRRANLQNINGMIRNSWVMVLVFWVGWMMGNRVALILFAMLSFFSLREFMP